MKASVPKASAIYSKLVLALGIGCALFFSARRADAFALLGPYESWMQFTNGLRQPGDIGGPMDIGNGYRWNVPVVTYGFDKSFMDYFGTNGVAAVEAAIQFLNDLPPASQMVVTNYPLNTKKYNLAGRTYGLVDLKSEALSLIIEQLGLAQPTRYTSVLKQWSPMFLDYWFEGYADYADWAYPDYIVIRNFDPITLLPSFYVDGIFYQNYLANLGYAQIIIPFPTDPTAQIYPAVADNNSDYMPQIVPGEYNYRGLTEDDAGGLCYLLSTNTINYENLLPDVRGSGRRRERLVNGAWRPGVDKLTFMPQPTERRTGRFMPMIYPYDDKYITNGILKTQRVERVISKPDFLFSAGNLTNPSYAALFYDRTATTNWINNSALNASSEGGPGVITPHVKITFNTIGHLIQFYADNFEENSPYSWASLDGSTNSPVTYPVSPQGIRPFVINMWLYSASGGAYAYEWPVTNAVGSVSLFQTSTNLPNWVTMFSATNDGTSWYLLNEYPTAGQRFYRVVPQ